MNYPSPKKRAAMSAMCSLLAPVGLVFWLGVLNPVLLDLEDEPAANLVFLLYWVHLAGAIPCVVGWAVGFRPFVIQGEKRPDVQSIFKLVRITATIGACWGFLFVLAFDANWVWLLSMSLAGIGPGLAYGLWLRRQMRGSSRSRRARHG